MSDAGKLKIAKQGDREIVITRVLDAPRQRVFDAHIKPELVQRWLLGPPGWTMPVCKIDARAGGEFRYVWKGEDGTKMAMGGEYREIAPPERIVCTELFDEDWTGGEALATLVLTERDGRTTLTNTVRYSSQEARDSVLMAGLDAGLAAGYDRLAELLASG